MTGSITTFSIMKLSIITISITFKKGDTQRIDTMTISITALVTVVLSVAVLTDIFA